MKLTVSSAAAVSTLTVGGVTFYQAFSGAPTWTPANDDDKFKFGKGANLKFADVTVSSITPLVSSTIELDETLSVSTYQGAVYMRPVGGRIC